MFWLTRSFVDEVIDKRIWFDYSEDRADVSDTLYDDEQNRQVWFLCVCYTILGKDSHKLEKEIPPKKCPYGGMIGCGDSFLEDLLKGSKLLRVHAAFHDAFGFCKTEFNKGPGYSYIIPFLWNSCLIGHISGLSYWWIFSKLYPSTYADILRNF